VQHEIERTERRELVTNDVAFDQRTEPRLDPVCGDLANQSRIDLRVERDERDIRDRALVAAARMRDRSELHVRPPAGALGTSRASAERTSTPPTAFRALTSPPRRRRPGRWCRA